MKNIVEAAKISGVQTPLYEFVALQPISVAFEQKEFNFFFRKFPNPLSRAGMKSYNYFISDTILRNNRRQIELNFSSKSDEKKSLHGMALIDANSFALTRFYAENQTQRGSDTYIEVVYQPVQNVWIPDYQIFKIEGNNVSSHSYQDSIAPNGETVQKKIIKKSKSWMNANTDFFDFESPATIDNQIFKGLKNEVPKSAFTDFDNKIKDFRGDDLIQRETTTYVTIDSIGKAEKVDRYIKIYRIISQEGWLSLGKLDLDLKELYTGNQYEDWRFGLSARTNHKLHPKLSANARAYYGTRDNVFKYGVGASYLVAPEKHARFFVDYSDDILAAGRFENPITTLFENLAWKSEQAANPFFVDENRISIGYEQDFFRKFTGRITLSKTPQKALFDYSFADFAPDYEYNLTQAQLAIRYAPREEAVITPMGKMRIIRDLPVYKLLIDQGLNFLNGEQEFTRIDFNANFSWNIFPSQHYLIYVAAKSLAKCHYGITLMVAANRVMPKVSGSACVLAEHKFLKP